MSDNTLRIGSVLHGPKRDYTVKNVLGQGGFGITYLVEGKVRVDNILVDAKFAVKEFFISSLCWRDDSQRLAYSKSQSDIISRSLRAFVREADRLKSLNINHPNLLNINEVFEANGTAYYVMEYLNGGSLAQYIKQRGRLSWDETVALCKPIVDAVALLHTNQVTHYDIKPQNIMLVQDGNALRPVLIDFGLAKHYDAQGNATSTGLSGGYTPGYAPVEQYHGIRSFQPTADVYALAATIYHCLTGHAPAAAETLDLDSVCDELLNLNVSAEAVNVLLQALDLRPTKRPATAAALLTLLFKGKSASTTITQPVGKVTVQMQKESNQEQKTTHIDRKPASDTPSKTRAMKIVQQIVMYLWLAFVTGCGVYVWNDKKWYIDVFACPNTLYYSLMMICLLSPIMIFIFDEIWVRRRGVKSWWMSWWCRSLKFSFAALILNAAFPMDFLDSLAHKEYENHGSIIVANEYTNLDSVIYKEAWEANDKLNPWINCYEYEYPIGYVQHVPADEQCPYIIKGLIINKGLAPSFVVRLEDENNGKLYNWSEAQQIVDNSGWRLPTEQELRTMTICYELKRDVLGSPDSLWTSDMADKTHAIVYRGDYCQEKFYVSSIDSTQKFKVRLVRDL